MSPLSFRGLDCGYAPGKASRSLRGGRGPVISGATASCPRGRLIGLIGPNGSGKSTLLSTLSGALRPLAGEILLDGREMRRSSGQELARRIAVVLTETERPAHARAWDVVALGRHPHTGFLGFLSPQDKKAVEEALAAAGAAPLCERLFSELSDGERRRVLIARALAQETDLLLLDEPEVFLDLPAKRRLLSLLADLAHEDKKAIVVSLHDIELALDSCDELWLLQPDPAGPARLLSGSPEDLALSGAIGEAFHAGTNPEKAVDGASLDWMEEGGQSLLSALDLLFPATSPPRSRGRFVLEGGQPEERFWTKRLLRRLCFVDGPERGRIILSREGGQSRWSLVGEEGILGPFPDLGELGRVLEARQYTTELV